MSVMAGVAIFSLILSLFASLMLPFTASAATNLFSDGFECSGHHCNHFSNWTSVGSAWDDSSDDYAGDDGAVVEDTSSTSTLRKAVSTAGYTGLTLSYYYKIPGGLSSSDFVWVQWSVDGTNWTTLRSYTGSATVANWVPASFSLPAGAENNSNFQFRFVGWSLESGDDFRLDEVSLVAAGVADTTAPVVTINVSSPVEATGSSGAPVTFSVSANEPLSGSITCTPTSGSTFPIGATTITCTATDTAGNTGSATASVMVEDTTSPVIMLNGDANLSLNVDEEYTEQGATATDAVDTCPLDIVITGAVDTHTPGIYTLYYNAADCAGNDADEVTRTITVSDVHAPVVTITPATQTVEATGPTGATASYTVSATDDVDGSLTATCDIASGSTFVIGVTTIICSATDSSDLTGTGSASVTVVDTTAPVITLTGDASVTVAFGGSYADAGATATDIVDGAVSVTVGGDVVNTNTSGTYTITYNAVDTHDNHAVEVTRTVTVGSAPVENTQGLCADGQDNDGDEAVDLADADCAAFIPAPETPSNENNNNGGGNGGGGGAVVSGPFSIGFVNTNTGNGQVLGASTELPNGCSAYLSGYLKKGMSNAEVKKLQTFLNQNLGLTLPVTGVFGPLTFDAVKAFQVKYADDILKPWFEKGLSKDMNASGYAYKMTIHKINLLQCATLNAPAPQLP